MPASSVVLLHDNVCPYTAACTRALLEHFNWELFDHHTYSPDLALNERLPTWRTRWDHCASTIMRNWQKVSKCGWAHRQQTSLTQAYINLFPNVTCASILAVIMLRRSWSMYVSFACSLNSSPEVTFHTALEHTYINSHVGVWARVRTHAHTQNSKSTFLHPGVLKAGKSIKTSRMFSQVKIISQTKYARK
jgi:hypothetical protein